MLLIPFGACSLVCWVRTSPPLRCCSSWLLRSLTAPPSGGQHATPPHPQVLPEGLAVSLRAHAGFMSVPRMKFWGPASALSSNAVKWARSFSQTVRVASAHTRWQQRGPVFQNKSSAWSIHFVSLHECDEWMYPRDINKVQFGYIKPNPVCVCVFACICVYLLHFSSFLWSGICNDTTSHHSDCVCLCQMMYCQ